MKLAKAARIVVVLGLASACVAALAPAASAKTGDVEASLDLDIAPSPNNTVGFGTAVGLTGGLGFEVARDLQARGDISFYNWSGSQFGANVAYTRVPIDAGLRKYFSMGQSPLRPFVEGEVELSFDSVGAGAPGGIKTSVTNERLGVLFAGGTEYRIDEHFGAEAMLKYHLVSNGYLTFALGMNYRF